MRILIVTATYSPSINGVSSTLKLQKKHLEKRGHEVTILAPKHPNQAFEEPGVIRIPSLPNPQIPDYPILVPIPTIHNLKIFSKKFDLIYFHHPFYIGEISLTLAKHFKCPTVFFYHSRYEKAARIHFPKFLFMPFITFLIWRNVRNIANQASHIIVGTASIRQILERKKIYTPVSVIPSIRKSMKLNYGSKSKFRIKYGLPKKDIVILCVSRLSKEKNLAALLRIVSQVKADISYTLCIVGDGKELGNLKSLAKMVGILDRCRFLGSIKYEDIVEIYSLADIFAYPCKVDTQALVILEAMSASLPIIAFNSPGPKDFIVSDENGYLVSNHEEFAIKIKLLLMNSKIRVTLGKNAYKNSLKYSPKDSANATEELFKKVVKKMNYPAAS